MVRFVALGLLCLAAAVNAEQAFVNHDYFRITDAQPIAEGSKEYQFIVSVRSMPKELHRCGGFLVHPSVVVTTSTCVYSIHTDDLYVYQSPVHLDNAKYHAKVVDIHTHPNFTWSPLKNDVAVLFLEKRLEGDTAPIYNSPVADNSAALSFGWGYKKLHGEYSEFTLHYKWLTVVSNAMCSLMLQTYVDCQSICASGTNLGYAMMDLGTPLVLKIPSKGWENPKLKYFAVGLLSRPTEQKVHTVTYTSLYPHIEWVRNLIEIGGQPETTTKPPLIPTLSTTQRPNLPPAILPGKPSVKPLPLPNKPATKPKPIQGVGKLVGMAGMTQNPHQGVEIPSTSPNNFHYGDSGYWSPMEDNYAPHFNGYDSGYNRDEYDYFFRDSDYDLRN